MGILGRINRVIQSNVNDMLDKVSDPAKEVELVIQEMENGLKQAREEVVHATAEVKRSGLRVDELQRDAAQWERRAVQAVQAGDDGLAKEALEQKLAAEQELQAVRQVQAEQNAYVGQLKDSLKELERKLKEVKLRKESIKQRARAAKEGSGALPGTKAFAEFQQLEDRIQTMEELGELTGQTDGRDAATEAKFARLEKENDPQVEDALAALKKKMSETE